MSGLLLRNEDRTGYCRFEKLTDTIAPLLSGHIIQRLTHAPNRRNFRKELFLSPL